MPSINNRIKLTGLLVVLLIRGASAQVLTLDSVFALIDRRNPALQEYDNNVKALNAYAEGARSWMAPMVGAGTFMTPYPGQRITESRDKGFVMISFEQSIPNSARLRANEKYLQSRSAVEEQARAYTFNTLRSEARMLYYQELILHQRMNLLKEGKTIIEFLLKLAQIRYPYDHGTASNMFKIEARQYEIENMILMTKGEMEDKTASLKALMNISDTAPLEIDTTTKVNFTLSSTASELIESRSDIKQIEKTIQAMQYRQQLQHYQARPDFRLRFDHMSPLGSGMPGQFTAMGMVSIPIAPWSSKNYKSEIKGITYDIEAMHAGRAAILTETRGKLSSLSSQIMRIQQQMDNYEMKILPALRKNYETLKLGYEENREQLPAVVEGWEAWNAAELEYLNKEESYYTLIVNYEKELEK